MSTLSMKKWLVTAMIALVLTLVTTLVMIANFPDLTNGSVLGVMFDDVRFAAVIVHEMGH